MTTRQDRTAERYLSSESIEGRSAETPVTDTESGAVVEFLGVVRGTEDGEPISHLDYEAYTPMAERIIGSLVTEAKQRWGLQGVHVRHRTGRVDIGEAAVLIRVESGHRAEAFEACRWLIDAVKHDVPIWKTAVLSDGTVLEVRCDHDRDIS